MKKRSLSLKLREMVSCQEEFKCPLSNELMRDPVVLATGQVCCFSTFDLLFWVVK
ncbi:U-box domain-containing protein 9 [Turnera subulata]|uniref:U-box domain-containing protein 9 n=1 Tax=Turnera subulata TaxID=218843 RepID=A0A9Q0F766_9ROSI|nr:U-box domain-containing protein 9 [Turnera subulata]